MCLAALGPRLARCRSFRDGVTSDRCWELVICTRPIARPAKPVLTGDRIDPLQFAARQPCKPDKMKAYRFRRNNSAIPEKSGLRDVLDRIVEH